MKKVSVKYEKNGVKMSIEFTSNDIQVEDDNLTLAYVMRSIQYNDFSVCGVYLDSECITTIDVK